MTLVIEISWAISMGQMLRRPTLRRGGERKGWRPLRGARTGKDSRKWRHFVVHIDVGVSRLEGPLAKLQMLSHLQSQVLKFDRDVGYDKNDDCYRY